MTKWLKLWCILGAKVIDLQFISDFTHLNISCSYAVTGLYINISQKGGESSYWGSFRCCKTSSASWSSEQTDIVKEKKAQDGEKKERNCGRDTSHHAGLFQDSARIVLPLQSDEINPTPGDRAAHSYLADKRGFLNLFHPFTEIKVCFHLPPCSPNSSEPINLRGRQSSKWEHCSTHTHTHMHGHTHIIWKEVNRINANMNVNTFIDGEKKNLLDQLLLLEIWK